MFSFWPGVQVHGEGAASCKHLLFVPLLILYAWDEGHPKPYVVVDGHDSWLQPNFLEYINSVAHSWHFALGAPYLTSLWQVVYASKLNGAFKIYWTTKAKDELTSPGMQPQLSATNVIPCMNKAIAASFAHVESNKVLLPTKDGTHQQEKFSNICKIFKMNKTKTTADVAPTTTAAAQKALLDSVNLSSRK